VSTTSCRLVGPRGAEPTSIGYVKSSRRRRMAERLTVGMALLRRAPNTLASFRPSLRNALRPASFTTTSGVRRRCRRSIAFTESHAVDLAGRRPQPLRTALRLRHRPAMSLTVDDGVLGLGRAILYCKLKMSSPEPRLTAPVMRGGPAGRCVDRLDLDLRAQQRLLVLGIWRLSSTSDSWISPPSATQLQVLPPWRTPAPAARR